MQYERLDFGDDPGFFELELGGQVKRLDIYEQHNTLLDLQAIHGDNIVALHQGVASHLGKVFGLPAPTSTALASKFITHVSDLVESVRKKLDGLPVSRCTIPDSTPGASAPSNVQPS